MHTRHLVVSCFLFFAFFCSSIFAQHTVSEHSILAKSDSPVSAVAWSADGSYFATTWNNSVIVWNAKNNAITKVFSDHAGPVKTVRFSQDGAWLLTLGEDNTIVVRNLFSGEGETRVSAGRLAPMNDAIFSDNSSSLILPRNAVAATLYYRLRLTNQFAAHTLQEAESPILSFDLTRDGTKLMITRQDGTISIIDVRSNTVVAVHRRFVSSRIRPVFSPDGQSFLAAFDQNAVIVSRIDGSRSFLIRDAAELMNSAVFSADGKTIAIALRDGGIKLYAAADGKQVQWFVLGSMSAPDLANALAFSADGSSLLVGAASGAIMRLPLDDHASREVLRKYESSEIATIVADREEEHDEPAEWQLSDASEEPESPEPKEAQSAQESASASVSLPDGIELSFVVTSLDESYYKASYGLTAAWRTCRMYPLYAGGGVEGTASAPTDDYPYSYTFNGETLRDPWLYRVNGFACAGLCQYIPGIPLLVFAETRLGGGIKFLYNNELTYSRTSKLSSSFQLDILIGAQWKLVRLALGAEYDTELGLLSKASLGCVIPLH